MSTTDRPDASPASKLLFCAGLGAVAIGNMVARVRDDNDELPAADD